ncbi:T9SS type A sorting domain-containing protein [bacterium SCSIO 12741]|nr:T9SS type A sorting domain-containing protein [bacterium SCSIO 12741]
MLLTALAAAQVQPNFAPIPSSFGINSANPVYALDVEYDNVDQNKQVFHLFLPDTTGTYPLVIFIHGGGFTGGSPDQVLNNATLRADIKYFLENGIAYASMGYRLLETTQADNEGVIKCLNDSKRGLQFIRHYSNDLFIDPKKIALKGSSAGAGTSFWLGTRSDMAEAGATDPVLQNSTRVCATALNGSQATYDLYKWETQVYQNFDGQGTTFTLDSIENHLGFNRGSNFYGGYDSARQILHDPALIQYRQEVDMLFHLSADDAPIYMSSPSTAVHPSDDLFHHPFHGREIQQAAIAANLSEVKANIPALSINTTQGETQNEFLKRHLDNCAQTNHINTSKTSGDLNLYPNPANDLITVHVGKGNIKDVEIYNLNLERMIQFQGKNAAKLSFTVSELPSGTYLIQIKNDLGEVFWEKISIK